MLELLSAKIHNLETENCLEIKYNKHFIRIF